MISNSSIIKEACGVIIIVLNYTCDFFQFQCYNNTSREDLTTTHNEGWARFSDRSASFY